MANTDIRKSVDGILKANKTLAGHSAWAADPDGGASRWIANIEINDEQPGVTVVIKVYPRSDMLKFSIILNYTRCIWRLDYTNNEHLNPLSSPVFRGILIREPHYHPWDDNRQFAKANSLPKRLRCARLLPEIIKNFHPAVRWFLAETNIYVDPADIPDLPKRDTLL